MSVPDEKGNPPLWLALANNLEDIASTLVRQDWDSLCCTQGYFVSEMGLLPSQQSPEQELCHVIDWVKDEHWKVAFKKLGLGQHLVLACLYREHA